MLLPSSARTLDQHDLKALIYGACFLASGGGGPISMAVQFLQRITVPVSLLPVSELSPDRTALMVVDLGSPDAVAQGHGFTAPVNAFHSLSAYLQKEEQKTISYLLPGEIGAVNSLIPFFIAASLNNTVAVIDADPCGRADPRLSETLLSSAGVPCCPALIASDTQSGTRCQWTGAPFESSLFLGLSPEALEEKARETVSQPVYHQVGGMACYPLDTNFLQSAAAKNALVYQSISAAIEVGDLLLSQAGSDALAALLNRMHIDNYQLIQGTVTQIINRTHGGFDVGKIVITAASGTFWLYFKNESLLAWDVTGQRLRVMAPDCINLLLEDNMTPVSTAEVKEQQQVSVWGTACPEKIRIASLTEQFLQDIDDALAAFPEDGLQVSQYIPVETLNA